MKTGISVVVNCPEDKNHGKKGFTTLTGSYHSTVVFYDDKEQATVPNKFLKPCAHVTRPNIESEALKSMGEKLQELKAIIVAEKERHSKYNTDAAIQGRATCEMIETCLEDLFHI
jgi:hypothetical protein